jgi:hypothetical protein
MAILLAFGVGLGNLGRSSRKRIPASAWIRKLNKALSAAAPGTQVVCSYGHTGNFVVSAPSDPETAAAELGDALGTTCAVMLVSDLAEIVQTLEDCPSPKRVGTGARFTRGAAFLIGVARDGLPPSTDCASYLLRRPKAVLMFKHDIETPSGILDRNRRRGGWGAVAADLGRTLGGTWTARSIRTLVGTLHTAHDLVRHAG